MFRFPAMMLVAALMMAGCDLPSDPDSARERLSRGEERVVTFEIPFPALVVNLKERLTDPDAEIFGLLEILDTADLSLRIDPDPFQIALGDFLEFEPVDLEPVDQGFEADIQPFRFDAEVQADPVPVTLPEAQQQFPLIPWGEGELVLPVDFSSDYATADFSDGSALTVTLATNATSSIWGVSARVRDGGGQIVTSSAGSVDVPSGGQAALSLPLGGRALPGEFSLDLVFTGSDGDGTLDGLTVSVGFTDAAVTAATGVDATRVTPIEVERRVALLAPATADVSEAVLESGTLELITFAFGTLHFSPAPEFETDLAGKQIGGLSPDSVLFAGTIGPPPGATTIDISTSGAIEVEVSNVAIESATIRNVDYTLERTAHVIDADSDDFRGVEEILVESGQILLAVQNSLPIGGLVTIRLDGAEDQYGQTLVNSSFVQPAPAGGGYATSQITLDLAGVTLSPASLLATATGVFAGTDVFVTGTALAEGVRVDPSTTPIRAASVTVSNAPDLSFDFEHLESFSTAELGLDDVTDVFDGIALNDVELSLEVDNPALIALSVDTLRLELIETGTGSAVLDPHGEPIRIMLSDFDIPGGGTATRSVDGTALVNELFQSAIQGRDISIRAAGRAGFGSATGTVQASDTLGFRMAVRAPFAITVPETGITLDHVEPEFIDMDSSTGGFIADLRESIVAGSLRLKIANATPLGLEIRVVLSPAMQDGLPVTDPFQAAKRFLITGLEMPPGQVDEQGRVVQPNSSTTSVVVPTDDLDVFREGKLALGIEFKLLPPAGGKAWVTANDSIKVSATARLEISNLPRAGGF